jgi:hypothetical protein
MKRLFSFSVGWRINNTKLSWRIGGYPITGVANGHDSLLLSQCGDQWRNVYLLFNA